MRPATSLLLLSLVCVLLSALPPTGDALDLRAALEEPRRMAFWGPVAISPTSPRAAELRRRPVPVGPTTNALNMQDWQQDGVAVVRQDPPVTPSMTDLSGSWSYCGDTDDILHIKSLVLEPDPPKRGEDIHITGQGHLEEDIVQGAVANVRVKFGVIKLLDKAFDLCEELQKQGNDRLKCPIEAGNITVSDVVHIPEEVPPGRYIINARVRNADGRRVTCVNARFLL